MRKILVTGMSGTGKSSALAELGRLGFRVVDTDVGGWSEWSDAEGGYVWREDRMTQLLARDDPRSLYVSGTVSNQGHFYNRFDAIVLLSAPGDVLLSRLEHRTANPYGKSPEQRELILRHLAEVEPLLRSTCSHELDAPSRSRTSSINSQNSVESLPLSRFAALSGRPRQSSVSLGS